MFEHKQQEAVGGGRVSRDDWTEVWMSMSTAIAPDGCSNQ